MVLKRIAVVETTLSDFETTVWSLGISAFMYGVFSIVTGITDIDRLRDSIFQQPYLLLFASIFAMGLLVVVSGGVIIRHHRGVIHGDCWERLMDKEVRSRGGDWVIIYTTDGREYFGQVNQVSFGRSRHEINIKSPTQIIRNKSLKAIAEIPLGDELIFTEADVRRVAIL
jgi:hypothetical protein